VKITLGNLSMYCRDCGDCLLWAQSVNSTGYPQASIGCTTVMVRRYVFTELLGQTIPKGCVIASRCGDRLCVAPEHLVAMKRGAVQALAYAAGRRVRGLEYSARLRAMEARGRTRLDWAMVREIRSRPREVTHAALAAEFGVSHKCMSRVRQGVTWRQQLPGSSVFALGG
jgi:hypothetical protein